MKLIHPLMILTAAVLTPWMNLSAQNDLHHLMDRELRDFFSADEPGASVLVRKGDQIILREAYGMAEMELAVPMKPEMVFRIASVTKQFTAAAIMLLAERGKLKISDDITVYFPDYPTHGKKVTLAHLLTHTSGIRSYTSMKEWEPKEKEDLSVAEMIDIFKDEPYDFEPGEQWRYNNSGYFLLGAIIEKLSGGMTYEGFIRKNIFEPLGMDHSYYDHPGPLIPGRAKGYAWTAAGWQNAAYMSMNHPFSAGSLMSTVDDLAKWEAALKPGKLLSEESLKEIFTPYVLNNGKSTNYGYGWSISEVKGRQIASHSGGINGFRSYILRMPEQELVVVLLTNRQTYAPDPGMVARRLAALAIGNPYPYFKEVQVEAETLKKYIGVYQVDENTKRTILLKDNQLFNQFDNGAMFPMSMAEDGTFFFKISLTYMRFVVDENGKVTGMKLYENGENEKLCPRVD